MTSRNNLTTTTQYTQTYKKLHHKPHNAKTQKSDKKNILIQTKKMKSNQTKRHKAYGNSEKRKWKKSTKK